MKRDFIHPEAFICFVHLVNNPIDLSIKIWKLGSTSALLKSRSTRGEATNQWLIRSVTLTFFEMAKTESCFKPSSFGNKTNHLKQPLKKGIAASVVDIKNASRSLTDWVDPKFKNNCHQLQVELAQHWHLQNCGTHGNMRTKALSGNRVIQSGTFKCLRLNYQKLSWGVSHSRPSLNLT